jgi:hypothetical protein
MCQRGVAGVLLNILQVVRVLFYTGVLHYHLKRACILLNLHVAQRHLRPQF